MRVKSLQYFLAVTSSSYCSIDIDSLAIGDKQMHGFGE